MLFKLISIVSLNLSIVLLFSLFLSDKAQELLGKIKNEDKNIINKQNTNTKNLYRNKDELEVWLLYKVICLDVTL